MTSLLLYGLKISLIGLLVVFSALTMIAGMVRLFGHLFAEDKRKDSKEKDDEISEEVIAAISAAVAVAIDRPFRVKRIQYNRRPSETDGWSGQGRVTIMASHITSQMDRRQHGDRRKGERRRYNRRQSDR